MMVIIIITKCMKVILTVTLVRAEERHKLVTASLNFYKTAEQVPTLPTISFPSLLSTSSYHHRAGANHHHCHHHHHHHVKVCSVLDSLEREYKREDDWLSRHVVMICIISLLSSADHHHHGNNWHNINVIFIITIFTIANINTVLTTPSPSWWWWWWWQQARQCWPRPGHPDRPTYQQASGAEGGFPQGD